MPTRSQRILAALAIAILTTGATPAVAQESDQPYGERLRTGADVRALLASRAARLGTSAGADPDTVYLGKSFTNHTAPDNYWNLYVGTYRPGTNGANNALWDWDNSVGIQAPDSLHGWWPYQREYFITGGLTQPDDQRPWWCVDHGNVGNYVIPAGSAAKRTFGVVGYWHDDPGVNAGGAVRWSPLSGSRSAWCGIRQHGDHTVKDEVTGNHYSGEAVAMYGESGVGQQLVKRLPGYLDQMDQLLYRDIAMSPAQSLTISFLYRTRMSTSIGTSAATRSGWFHGDPLAVVSGNFISSSAAGANAPQDSFMVYVGAPVDDAACVYSDGVTRAVHDKQRRWFSEVLKVFGAGANYFEILRKAGNNPVDTLSATPSSGPLVVPAAQISAILGGVPGNVRLVFRVKTNRGSSDIDSRVSGYSSLGRGPVQVDDVTIDRGAGPELIGDFETPQQGGVNAIDNRYPLPLGLESTDVWRSTGKPLPAYMHVEAVSGLTYNDLCGPPGSPTRHCNLTGNVLVTGNHDLAEAFGDSRFAALREARTFAMSPTINLVGGPGGTANSQGITSSIAHATDDLVLWYDLYWGYTSLSFSGMSWDIGYQAYPSVQTGNGGKSWSDRHYAYSTFNVAGPECFYDFQGFAENSMPLSTSNPSGIPDSLRLLIGTDSQCFRFGITLACNSTDGSYFDNVSLAFVDLPGVPGQASATSTVSLGTILYDSWQPMHDTFPANETAGLPGTPAFDTTSALVRSGLNTAQLTGTASRFDIPGDSTIVLGPNATVGTSDDPALATIRMDLVFRILPGPGNYQIAAGRGMVPGGNTVTGTLLQLPTNQAAAAVPGDGSFWGQYMADPGLVSAGTHGGPGGWDPLTWNSCRMDTVQLNMFPVGFPVFTSSGLTPGFYQTTIHELDPKFATLGVNKFKCFVIDTTKAAATNTGPGGTNNVACDGTVPGWLTTVPQSRTGYDGSPTTKEFTKIVPDGLLTPGSHVQYFFRKSHSIDPLSSHEMCPDTNFITPQSREGSTDQHRWQQFSVLPDRWKNTAFGGEGMACMLYVDWNDRRGNEGRFVGVMDSLAGTSTAKYGAHNGWHAPGDVGIDGLDVRSNMSVAVSNKNSQPGTTWDMYGVKASESTTTSAGQLGSRLANRAGMGYAAGRESRQGPTPEMLRTYYRMLTIHTGGLNAGIFGPFVHRSQNDIALLNDYLTAAGGKPQPRGIFVQGDGFVEGETATGGIDPAHTQFLADKLGVVLGSPAYLTISGFAGNCTDLLTTTALTPNPDVYGVAVSCNFGNDVLLTNGGTPEAVPGAYYENAGTNGPYIADVVKPATIERNWIAVTSGYEIEHLFSRYCDTSGGRLAYYYYMLNNVFGVLCPTCSGAPCVTLDTPRGTRGRDFVDFMKVGDAVMRHATPTVRLGVAHAGRVQVAIYDVAGRKVRVLADRVFPVGEHTLTWDGADDDGRGVPRGVYFVRSSNQKDAKRIIVVQR